MSGIKNTPNCGDKRKLAIIIYHFLQNELLRKDLSNSTLRLVTMAADCLHNVYRFKVSERLFSQHKYNLPELYNIGYKPIPVRNRIKAEVHKQNGNSFMQTRAFEQAEAEYTKAIELDGTNAVYFSNRAVSKIVLGNAHSAVEDCRKALELDPQYVKAYNGLGLAYVFMEYPAKALKFFKKALKIEPGNKVSLANMDLIHGSLNRKSLKVLQPFYRETCTVFRNEVIQKFCKKSKDTDNDEKRKMLIQQKCENAIKLIPELID